MTEITKLVKRLRVLSERQMGMGTSEPSDHIAWEAADALEAQAERIAEQDYVLEMKWRAEDRAIKAWQAKTGEHLTWPDQAKLVEWLMDELHTARARIAELEVMLEVDDDEIQLLENRLRVALDAVKEDTARIAEQEAENKALRAALKETLARRRRTKLGEYQLRALAALNGEKE